MSIKTENIPLWVANRILQFFNEAGSIHDILDGTIQDDPSNGPGRTISRALAARILKERNAQPRGRFTELAQLDAVKGVGPDAIRDFAYSFGTPAAQAFQTSMYDDGLIYRENWDLLYWTISFESEEAFQETVQDEAKFRKAVAGKIGEICKEREIAAEACEEMIDSVKTAYIDTNSNSTEAANYALALWFYRFDADNWFSYYQVLQETQAYFGYYAEYPWETELRFFKGFRQRILNGITPPDLPVVVSWPEQTITIWISALYD